MSGFIEYMQQNSGTVLNLCIEHIQLTVIAIAIAILIGVPLGILITYFKPAKKPIMGMTNIIQAIPSMALLGFMIPLFGIGTKPAIVMVTLYSLLPIIKNTVAGLNNINPDTIEAARGIGLDRFQILYTKPAIVMVTLYSLLPIIKNTVAGLNNINPDTIEAARGIGLDRFQILYKVQIPLAAPVIMAGVRISAVGAVGLMTLAAFIGAGGLGYLVYAGIRTVNNAQIAAPVIMAGVRISAVGAVGLMTLAAFIGAGGLGYLVYAGIRTVNNAQILAGAVPACILALLIDYIFSVLERVVTPKNLQLSINRSKFAKIRDKVVVAALCIALIGSFVFSAFSKVTSDREITIGSMDFTEQEILNYILKYYIEDNSDIKVNQSLSLGASSIVLDAIKGGDVDLYVDYTGTIYGSVLGKEPNSNVEEVYNTVKDEMKSQYSMDFTEQEILNYILKYYIEDNSDIKVNQSLSLGASSIVLDAIKGGDVDLYVDYTGTIYGSVLGKEPNSNVEEVYNTVKDEMKSQYKLNVLK